MKDGYFSFDPIYALATPFGTSAIAIYRVSGEGSIGLLNKILDKEIDLSSPNFLSNKALFYRAILHPETKKVIDTALVSVFRNKSGYTKEEAAEISIHGSIAVIKILAEILEKTGFRLAKRGEFTFRALQNGTLTLLESEAVLELIESQSEKTREAAIRRLSGVLDKKINEIYKQILEVFSIFELQLDYSDEEYDENVEFPSDKIEKIKTDLSLLLESFKVAKKEENGIKIVLLGKTNAGKSTLFNALLRENRSIVSSKKGTTRDFIKETIEIDGHKVVLYDTAGLNDNPDSLEKHGIERTKKLAKEADIIIKFLSDADLKNISNLKKDEKVVFVRNKCDKDNPKDLSALPKDVILLSAKTGFGLDTLLSLLSSRLNILLTPPPSISFTINSLRQKRLLEEALLHITALKSDEKLEILSAETQSALACIRELSGIDDESGNQEVLDEIFSRFCVGK